MHEDLKRIFLGDIEIWRHPQYDALFGAGVLRTHAASSMLVGDKVELSRTANIRSAGNANASLVGVNPRGWRGEIVDGPLAGPSNTSWYKVRFYRDKWNGWVLSDNLTRLADSAPEYRTPAYFVVKNTVQLFRDANLRNNPALNSELLEIVEKNASATITQGPTVDEQNNVWYKLSFNTNTVGWVVSDNYLLTGSNTSQPQPNNGSKSVHMADAFVESIGIVAHVNFAGFWTEKYNYWRPALGATGIRYVRTRLGTHKATLDRLLAINSAYGIKYNLTMNPLSDAHKLINAEIVPELTYARDNLGVNKIVSVEGPNEYSATKYQYNNTTWVSELTSFQNALYTNTKLILGSQMPVLTTSIWKRIAGDFSALGLQNADVGNLHYYSGGRIPSQYSDGTMDDALKLTEIIAPGKPKQITEIGFNNTADTVDSPFAVPEYTQAKYTNRTYAETFFRGVERTYLYVLMDRTEDLSREYGLLRADATATKKPAYYALKNLISIMSDPGPSFATNDLSYTLTGNQTNVRHLVFQKRDKSFYFMIWLDGESFIQKTAKEVDVAPRSLTLDVSAHTFTKAEFYYPTAHDLPNNRKDEGAAVAQTVNNPTVLNLSVPDHVMIVRLR